MSFLFDKLFQKQNPELASEMAKRGLIFDRIKHRWVKNPVNRAQPKTVPKTNRQKDQSRRYPTNAERAELVNLYHLARTAGKEKRWDRLQWATENFVKEHPDWTHASAYKSVEQAVNPYR